MALRLKHVSTLTILVRRGVSGRGSVERVMASKTSGKLDALVSSRRSIGVYARLTRQHTYSLLPGGILRSASVAEGSL
jgi:hypothetical protein